MQPIASYEDYAACVSKRGDIRTRMLDYMNAHPHARFEHILHCAACGYYQVHPLPSADALGHFYQNYGGNTGYAKKEGRKIARTTARLKRIRRYISSGRFLDVGANMGFAVEAAHRLGFAASGIEIDAEAVAQASARYPHNHFTATMIEHFMPSEAFDLVHCAEVIEHVPDMHSFVSHLARLTETGGYLYLTTPDASHLRVPKTFVNWAEVKPPEHITWFSKQAIRVLLNAHGFDVVRLYWNLKPGIRLLARKL